MESLPEAVLLRILAAIPAVDLVLACRLVCCQWKNLVDGAALWILKCQQEGLTGAESQEDAENWQNFYFLSKKRKNLIKNPCGEGETSIASPGVWGGDQSGHLSSLKRGLSYDQVAAFSSCPRVQPLKACSQIVDNWLLQRAALGIDFI